MRRLSIRSGLSLATIALLSAGTSAALSAQRPAPAGIIADHMTGDITGVHDPAIIKAGDTFYVFSTTRPDDGGQIPIRTSKDLLSWRTSLYEL